MWEPWEFRDGEVDLTALRNRGVPIIATAETHPDVRTLDYLGPTIARLLLDSGIEVIRSHLLVLGSDPFGGAVEGWLAGAGAIVSRADSTTGRHRSWQHLSRSMHSSSSSIAITGLSSTRGTAPR